MTSKENIDATLRASGGPPFKIKKIDAARRQLLTAIEVWFLDGDPVSIHSLAHAPHEIIHRLFRNQGGSALLFDSPELHLRTQRNGPNERSHLARGRVFSRSMTGAVSEVEQGAQQLERAVGGIRSRVRAESIVHPAYFGAANLR